MTTNPSREASRGTTAGISIGYEKDDVQPGYVRTALGWARIAEAYPPEMQEWLGDGYSVEWIGWGTAPLFWHFSAEDQKALLEAWKKSPDGITG